MIICISEDELFPQKCSLLQEKYLFLPSGPNHDRGHGAMMNRPWPGPSLQPFIFILRLFSDMHQEGQYTV